MPLLKYELILFEYRQLLGKIFPNKSHLSYKLLIARAKRKTGDTVRVPFRLPQLERHLPCGRTSDCENV